MPKPIKIAHLGSMDSEVKITDSEIEHHRAKLELDKDDPEDDEAKEAIALNTTSSASSNSAKRSATNEKSSTPTRTGRNTSKSRTKKSQ